MESVTHTLAGACSLTQEIRKSRFLARAAPVEDTAQALDFVHSEAASTPDANHHCWAWRVGQDYRFNDDGEPSGTAGKPILQAIDGQGLDRVVVVVTRWFGGIKLGAGGLVRAYGGCAAECLRHAATEPLVARLRMAVEVGFAELPLLKARMAPWQAQVEHESFGAAGATLVVSIPEAHAGDLDTLVSDLTRGTRHPVPLD